MELSKPAVETPDAESETPTRIHPGKLQPLPLSSNGVLKRHAPLHLHHGRPVVVTYKECLKNHAASLGGHAVDGCGEFMPSPASNSAEPTSLKCAACGCHRNFHRREPEDPLLLNAVAPALEYRPHHRHHPPPPIPPPPPHSGSPDNSPSPPPISSSYYPSAPHMLLALSHGLAGPLSDNNALIPASGINTSSSQPLLNSNSRKRFRTKFTQNQKEKMLEFAETIGWKIQKKDEDFINGFCSNVGVERGVLKVWMHNNKNHSGKKDHHPNSPPPPPTNNGGEITYSTAAEDFDSKESFQLQEMRHHHHHQHDDNGNLGTTDGSSSS